MIWCLLLFIACSVKNRNSVFQFSVKFPNDHRREAEKQIKRCQSTDDCIYRHKQNNHKPHKSSLLLPFYFSNIFHKKIENRGNLNAILIKSFIVEICRLNPLISVPGRKVPHWLPHSLRLLQSSSELHLKSDQSPDLPDQWKQPVLLTHWKSH